MSTAKEDQSSEKTKPHVLVIDDRIEYSHLFVLIADALGVNIQVVESCSEGVARLRERPYDIILMDWLMPSIDGIMCTHMIRKNEKNSGRHTIIIGVTGYSGATKEKSLEAGMDDFLAIPFTLDELQGKLSYWLALHADPKQS
jgi:CheY-like chemotaxis protein